MSDPASLVDPLIGTANGGNVFPGADTPFGMVQFSPDETNGNQAANVNSSGYSDGVNRIRGFGLAHVSGAGCGGLAGDVPFFPYVGDVATSPAADVKDATVTADAKTAGGGTSYDGGSSGGVSTAGGNPTPGKGSGAYVQFDTTGKQQVGVRVGVSYVDPAGAQKNLDAEQPEGTTFDSVATKAHDAWNTQLNRIEIDGGITAQQKIFYTALYHSLLHMNVYSDVDGRWDRWTHNSGAVSVMSGDPSPAFVDTVLAFGGTKWNAQAGLESLVRSATVPTPADLSHNAEPRRGRHVAGDGQGGRQRLRRGQPRAVPLERPV